MKKVINSKLIVGLGLLLLAACNGANNSSTSAPITDETQSLLCAAPDQTVVVAGNNDDFDSTDGAELSFPSLDLQGVLSQFATGTQGFDGVLADRVFGHTFIGLPAGIVAATLDVHLQTSGPTLTYNDSISLELAGGGSFVWGRAIAQLPAGVGGVGSWTHPEETLLSLDLEALPLAGSGVIDILPNVNADQALDVYLQDDTNVDYMVLTVWTCPLDVDIQAEKTVSDPSPAEGDTITYTITVSNLSPNPATGLVVTDLLPAGVTFVSYQASTGTYDDSTGDWNIGNIGPFIYVTLVVTVTVDSGTAGQTLTNTATVTALDQTDTDSANDTASVLISVVTSTRPDLALQKFANGPFHYGQFASYTLLIENTGDAPASSPITVVDVLPAGMTFVSYFDPYSTDWSCTASGQQVTCTYTGPPIAPGGSLPTLIINVIIDTVDIFPGGSDQVENCATVQHPADANPTNDQSCVDTIITVDMLPDLTVLITSLTLGSCGGSGCTVIVDFVVQNIGNAASGPFEVLLEANGFTPLTVQVGGGLGAGGVATLNAILGPGGVAGTAPIVIVTVDSGFVVTESDEANNSDSRTL